MKIFFYNVLPVDLPFTTSKEQFDLHNNHVNWEISSEGCILMTTLHMPHGYEKNKSFSSNFSNCFQKSDQALCIRVPFEEIDLDYLAEFQASSSF